MSSIIPNSSGSERNFSDYDFVATKRRLRFGVEKQKKLVLAYEILRHKARKEKMPTIPDPLEERNALDDEEEVVIPPLDADAVVEADS